MLATVLADNRRSAYRVRPIVTDNLSVTLLLEGSRFRPREVADVTHNGASIRFDKPDAPRLKKGHSVRMEIESPNLPGGATITADIVFCGESTTERLFGMSFTDTRQLEDRAPEQLFQLFNRRQAYRDDETQPIATLRATVMPPPAEDSLKRRLAVTVRNLSTTGICLVADSAADAFMQERDCVRVALDLPARDEPSEIVTRVRYRSVVDGVAYYGCHFDWPATPQAQVIHEDLTEYTLDRFDEGFVILNT